MKIRLCLKTNERKQNWQSKIVQRILKNILIFLLNEQIFRKIDRTIFLANFLKNDSFYLLKERNR